MHLQDENKHRIKTTEQDIYWLPLYYILYPKKRWTSLEQISQKHLQDIISYLYPQVSIKMKTSSLVNMLDAYVSFNSEMVQLENIITGQLYTKEIFQSLITVE